MQIARWRSDVRALDLLEYGKFRPRRERLVVLDEGSKPRLGKMLTFKLNLKQPYRLSSIRHCLDSGEIIVIWWRVFKIGTFPNRAP